MSQSVQLARARIVELDLSGSSDTPPQPKDGGKNFEVQFNPASLKVNFTNQKSGGEQPGGAPTQFIGQGTTKLTMELFFDVTGPVVNSQGNSRDLADVRTLTADIAHFLKGSTAVPDQENAFVPPGIRFNWGNFLFDGTLDSMDETLDFFSEDGRALRSTVAISISKQEISIYRPEEGGTGGGPPTGTQAMSPAQSGDSVQKMAGKKGKADQWKSIAAANDIENPRHIPAGTLINLANTG